MSEGLKTDYDTLIRQAAALGLTTVHGKTPREHQADLLRAGPWLEDDVRRLTEMVEGGVFADSESMAREGRRICRRLAAELPKLPPLPNDPMQGVPVPTLRWYGRAPRFIRHTGIPIIATAMLLWLAVFGPDWSMVPRRRTGGRGGNAIATPRIGGSPWTNAAEKSAVRELIDDWDSPPRAAVFEEVVVPEVQDPPELGAGAAFDFDTGTDHIFANSKEPCDPPLNHHHRQFVYAEVDPLFRFRETPTPLRSAMGRGTATTLMHTVDLRIQLRAGEAIPVPVPAPDSVVTAIHGNTSVKVSFAKDPADALRAIADKTGPARLQYSTATFSDYLLAPLPRVRCPPGTFATAKLPPTLQQDAMAVLGRIGWSPNDDYRKQVRRLHAYFAGFDVAPLLPAERRRSAYLTLAMARKGTCRHRAMTFVVTALAAGIPARLVTNDIHAFAEVRLPNGNWRALEFRLLDRERLRRKDLSGTLGISGIVGLSIFIMAGLVLAVLASRGAPPHLEPGKSPARARLRAARDLDVGTDSVPLVRLVGLTLNRLSEHLGVDPEDREALRRAVGTDRIPVNEHRQVVALLELEDTTEPGERLQRYRLGEAYWSAKSVLRWLDGRQEP